MIKKSLAVILCACVPGIAAAERVYKCTDADGVVTYSDKLCSQERGDATLIDVGPKEKRPEPKAAPPPKCKASRDMFDLELRPIRVALQSSLFDANSARFMDMRICEDTPRRVFCGKVNAKNRLGAYVGFRSLIGTIESGKTEIIGVDDASSILVQMHCVARNLAEF